MICLKFLWQLSNLLLLLLIATNSYTQKKESNFLSNTQLIGGVYIHEIIPLVGIAGQGQRYPYVTPEVGIQHRFNNSPISVSYRRVWNYVSDDTNEQLVFNQQSTSTDSDEIDQFFIHYHLEKQKLTYRFGLGYFHKRWITPPYFRRGGTTIFEYRGPALATAFDLKSVSVEFKKYIDIPNQGVLEAHLYAISLNKFFPLKKKEDEEEPKYAPSFLNNFSLSIAMRLRAIEYYHTQNKDLFNFFGFAPGIAFSYFDPKRQLDLILSRDSWKRYTGGTLANDLIGYISISGIAIRKHLMIGNHCRRFIVGLGWYPIRNDNRPLRVIQRTIFDEFGNEIPRNRFSRMNVYGVGISLDYQLSKHYEIGYRHVFPYAGDNFFAPWYSSLGLAYRM